MVIVDVLVEVMVLRAYCLIKLYPETVKFSWVGIFWATQFNVLESFMLNTYSFILILKHYWKHNIKKNLCYKILSPFSMVLLYNIEGSFCQLLYLVNPKAVQCNAEAEAAHFYEIISGNIWLSPKTLL